MRLTVVAVPLLLASLLACCSRVAEARSSDCDRALSREARKIVQRVVMPYVKEQDFLLPDECPLHQRRDLYRRQEESKKRVKSKQWTCKKCDKVFKSESFLDQHMDRSHTDMLVEDGVCLADFCDVLQCDTTRAELAPRCNDEMIERLKYKCHSLVDRCFTGYASSRMGARSRKLNELFQEGLCDVLSCDHLENGAPVLRSLRKPGNEQHVLGIFFTTLLLLGLCLFYVLFGLYRRDLKFGEDLTSRRKTRHLSRLSRAFGKKPSDKAD